MGIAETAANSKQTFEGIIALRQHCEQEIMLFGKRAKPGQALLKELYSQPILHVNQISARLNTSHQAASAQAKSFEAAGILRELTGYKRNRLFVFSEYLNLFSDNKHSSPKDGPQ